jgi:hypothetical protein
MADFEPFSLGNVLSQAENIRGARNVNALREQQLSAQNALTQQAAQFNPLFQQFLAGEVDANALASVDPERAQQALEFQQAQVEQQRVQEQQEADEVVRGVQLITNAASPSTLLPLAFPEFVASLEDQGIDVSTLTDEMIRDELGPQLLAQFGPQSTFSLEELGLEPDEFRSTAGKQFEDRQRLVNQFGEGSPEVTRFDASTAKGGQRITVDPETGQVVFEQGALSPLQKKTAAQVEADIVNIDDSIARLDAISQGVDDRFLQVPGRLDALVAAGKEKFGIGITADDRRFLSDISEFKRDAIENINLEIKRITGAQMSEKEATRIRQGFPDPGEGLFDGDAPTVFRSKLAAVRRQLLATRIRRGLLLRQGINTDEMSQEDRNEEFDRLDIFDVQERMAAREAELLGQGLPREQILEMLRTEFGL